MTPLNILILLASLAGVYGAVLSTHSALASRREKQRTLKLSLSTGFPVTADQLGDPIYIITAANAGFRPVTIASLGMLLPNNKELIFTRPLSEVRFPHELTEGKSCMDWMSISELAKSLRDDRFAGKVRIVGYANDAVGTRHLSKAVKFNVDGWLSRRHQKSPS